MPIKRSIFNNPVVDAGTFDVISSFTPLTAVKNGGANTVTLDFDPAQLNVASLDDADLYARTDTENAFSVGQRIFTKSRSITAASTTLTIDSAGETLLCNNASAQTITIPPQSSVSWITDTEFAVIQLGAGVVTIQGGTGVTINGVSAGSEAISARYESCIAKRVSSDVWVVTGSLT